MEGSALLTDIFAHRYRNVQIRQDFDQHDRALIAQMFALLSEDIAPRPGTSKEAFLAAWMLFWHQLERRLARELGVQSLAETYDMVGRQISALEVCHRWMFAKFSKCEPADTYIKARLSLVELGFRQREKTIANQRRTILADLAPQDIEKDQVAFDAAVNELNVRLRRAGYPLHYHNGFLQISGDKAVEVAIEEPFWKLVGPKWRNIDIDMKEAIDRRDTGGREPALYAARALESAIKIISGEKGWTRGKETGAHGYIDNLVSQANGRFIEVWEADQLKGFFTNVRNPLGHGPGGEPMPSLTEAQTDWAIAFCMAWIRSLIVRT
jgi:hypothetical protein